MGVVRLGDTVSVELPVPPAVRVTVGELKDIVSPIGDDAAVRLTVPAKPLRLVSVMVDVAEVPCVTFSEVGLAVMLKFEGAP